MNQELVITDQWSDFLNRQFDPYATAKYEILLDWMGNLSGKTAIVVGCGSGEFCAMLAIKGAKVHAVDIEEKNVALARETAVKFKTNFTTEVGRIEILDENIKYDFVIATDVIEHIEDDKFAVKKLKSVMAAQGVMVITVPAFNLLFGYHDEILGHYRRYSASMIKRLLKDEFKITRMRYFGFFLMPVTLLISCLLRRPYPVAAVGKTQQGQSFLGRVLKLFFQIEKKVNLGAGTSLLLTATKP